MSPKSIPAPQQPKKPRSWEVTVGTPTVDVDGTNITHVEQRAIDLTSLSQLQEIVGGDIELVRIGMPYGRLIVNETGLLRGLLMNPWATGLYRGSPPKHDGQIVGTAIFVRESDFQAAERILGEEEG